MHASHKMAIADFPDAPIVFCLVCGYYSQYVIRSLPGRCPGKPSSRNGGRANVRNRLLAGTHPTKDAVMSDRGRYNTAEVQQQQRQQRQRVAARLSEPPPAPHPVPRPPRSEVRQLRLVASSLREEEDEMPLFPPIGCAEGDSD